MKKYVEIEKSINKFSSLDLSGIDEYYEIGEKISAITSNDIEFKRVFSLYCRNYCNFLINHTDFNYLLEVYNNVNSEIINDFTNNNIYIKTLINTNNKIFKMVKTDNFNINLDDIILSNWEPLDIYIKLLKKINIEDNTVFDKGDILPMRIWVDTLVLNDRLENLKNLKDAKKKIAMYDIYRFFHWISLRYKKLLTNKNDKSQIKKVDLYIKKLSKNINDTTKQNIIIEAIGIYQNYLKNLKEMADKIPSCHKNINKFNMTTKEMVPTVLVMGAVLVSGIIIKAIN
jgi:hypothetical protein